MRAPSLQLVHDLADVHGRMLRHVDAGVAMTPRRTRDTARQAPREDRRLDTLSDELIASVRGRGHMTCNSGTKCGPPRTNGNDDSQGNEE